MAIYKKILEWTGAFLWINMYESKYEKKCCKNITGLNFTLCEEAL